MTNELGLVFYNYFRITPMNGMGRIFIFCCFASPDLSIYPME